MATKIIEADLDAALRSKINSIAQQGIDLKTTFGAVGDGVTDDTDAIIGALAHIVATGNSVRVPPGVYLCDPFTLDVTPYASQGFFYGDDQKRCVFKRKGTGSNSFVQFGSDDNTSFQATFPMRFMSIDGGAKTNGPAFTAYDLVRAKLFGVGFAGGTTACRLFGGISISFHGAIFEGANRGLEVLNYVSSPGTTAPSGGGWPNLIKVYGGEIVDNAEWGVFFNGGRMLSLDSVDVEGNGTSSGAAQGGVYVGPNVGLEVSTTATFSKGLIAKNCWFEANKGTADVALDSGINTLQDCLFFSPSATHDVAINSGKYRIRDCSSAFPKAANVLETSSVSTGNAIEMCEFPALSYDNKKTTVKTGTLTAINGGAALASIARLKPVEQYGTVDGTGGVSGTVTFPTPFKTGTVPRIDLQVQNNSGGSTIDQPDLFNVTNTGFSYLKKSYNGTAIATVNYLFTWRAIGEAV